MEENQTLIDPKLPSPALGKEQTAAPTSGATTTEALPEKKHQNPPTLPPAEEEGLQTPPRKLDKTSPAGSESSSIPSVPGADQGFETVPVGTTAGEATSNTERFDITGEGAHAVQLQLTQAGITEADLKKLMEIKAAEAKQLKEDQPPGSAK